MDIVLINPSYMDSHDISKRHDTYRSLIEAGNMYVFPFEPPLGLASLLSVLHLNGISAKLLDLQAEEFTISEIVSFLKNNNPRYVGISAMTTTYPRAIKVAELVKKTLPQCKVILGGIHPTIMPEDTIAEECFDYIIRGEAEESLVQLLKTNSTDNQIDGIVNKKSSKNIDFKTVPHVKDLDVYPPPDYDSFPIHKYVKYNESLRSLKAISMIVSRGCPYPCSFCAVNQTMGRSFRIRNPKNVVEDMATLQEKYGVEGIWFKDSIFNLNKKWVYDFCGEIKRRDLNMKWQINTRIDHIDEEQLSMMVKAGLEQIDLGIESGSPTCLRTLNKNITVDQIEPAIKIAKKHVKVSGFFMIGIPDETEEEIEMTFTLAKRLKLDKASWSIFTPLPGSLLFDNLKLQGCIPKKVDWSQTHFIDSNISYSRVPHEKLLKYFWDIQEYFNEN